jgi:predicted dehydrogenase
MMKIGLIGIGSIGRVHLNAYLRLKEEKYPMELCTICDFDTDKFQNKFIKGNIEIDLPKYDFSQYRIYTDIDEMFKEEKLDMIDIALPTYLHKQITIKALENGYNVLCEKPMALSSHDCQKMLDTSIKHNKKLMVGQCLRFWPAYEYLKECVANKKYGNVLSAYFFRGGAAPRWSYNGWMREKDKSGGALVDLHIHDTDMIHWLFGKPESVSTVAKNVFKNSGYDIVSANYLYDDKVITAQADWTLEGDYGFKMLFRVSFDKANIIFENNTLIVNPNEGKGFIPEISTDGGHYREIKYFCEAVLKDLPVDVAPPESTVDTMKIIEAEIQSADNRGSKVKVE